MSDDVLITSNHMQKQAERLKFILDNEGKWKLNGDTAELGYKYKNTARNDVTIKGVKSTEGLTAFDKEITVSSTSIDSDTQITIYGAECSFTLPDKVNAMVTSPKTKITAGAGNSSVFLTADAATSSIYSDGNCYIDNAAPSVKIIGNFGNDTVLNTGVAVNVTTGKEAPSSISDYVPYSDSANYFALCGGADSVYVDQAAAEFGISSDTTAFLSFGDKATIATDNTGSGNNKVYLKRAKNAKLQLSSSLIKGNDSITVGAGVGGSSIVPYKLGDYVTIDSGAGGNIYVFNPADGDDTIVGWNADRDTLQIVSTIADSYMSKDGNDLAISVKGGGSILLKGVGATVTSEIKSIYIKTSLEAEAGATVVPYAMNGTSGADFIENVDIVGLTPLRNGASDRSTVLVIDTGVGYVGYDTITNEGSYVSIIGGAGNDSIFNNSNGNIFYYTGSSGEGTDSLSAFNSDDLIYINDSDCTVTDSIVSGNARLQITKGTTNTYVLMIGKTTGDTVRVKLGVEGAIQTYTIGSGFFLYSL